MSLLSRTLYAISQWYLSDLSSLTLWQWKYLQTLSKTLWNMHIKQLNSTSQLYKMPSMVNTCPREMHTKIWNIFIIWVTYFQLIIKLEIIRTNFPAIDSLWSLFNYWRCINRSSRFKHFKNIHKLNSSYLNQYTNGFLDDWSTTWRYKFISDFCRWTNHKVRIS